MAIELNNRTKILAGVVVLAAAGAGAWFFLFQDEAPPPRAAVAPAATSAPKAAGDTKAPDAPKGDAAKAADAPKTADAAKPAAEAPKQTAAPAGAKPAPKPAPGSPEQLVAEVIDASGIKTQFQPFSRDTLMRAVLGDTALKGADPADIKAMSDMVERAFEPAALNAELAENLKTGLDAERMARFLEILRQPAALKINGADRRNLTPEAIQEYTDGFRKNPPPDARVKAIQALDGVTLLSESSAEHATSIMRDMYDTIFAGMQKAGKSVPKEARQELGTRINAARNQIRAHIRSMLYVAYRDVSDQDLAEYVKLIDTDTGRWGMGLLANAAKPALASRGSELGKQGGQLAMSKRPGPAAKAPAAPAPEPLAKAAAPEAPAAAPTAAAPVEAPGYQRAANIRELYTRYNDLITATVMRDQAAVKQLLDDGKAPNIRQTDGMTPLMIAAGNGDAAIAGLLLAKGADPNLRAAGGATALSIAKSRGAAGAELVQQLQRSGAKD